MKGTSIYSLCALLAPELRARLGTVALVFVLGTVAAFSAKAPLLLIEPLLEVVLFPDGATLESGVQSTGAPSADGATGTSATGAARAAAKSTKAYGLFLDGFEHLQRALAAVVYGPEPAPDALRMAALWEVAGLMLVLTVLGAAAIYAQITVERRLALELVVDLRTRIARHLMGLSMRYHGERKFGDLLSRVSSDVTKTLMVINLTLRDLLQQPLSVLFSVGFAAAVAPLPTLVFLVLLPLAVAPIAVLGRRVRKRSKQSQARLGDSVEVLTQAFTGMRTVKAFRAEERELARYHGANRGYLRASMKMVRAVATINAWSHVTSFLGFTVVLIVAGWFAIRQPLFENIGQMAIFLAAVGSVYQSVKRFTNTINKVQESAGSAERLQELLEERADLVEREGAVAIRSLGSGIAFEGVSFSYPAAGEALEAMLAGPESATLDAAPGSLPGSIGSEAAGDDGAPRSARAPRPASAPSRAAIAELDLQVRPGETLALVGPSGAGKTTLVDLIARFIDPDQGRITVDGHDLRDLTLDSWTAQYAMVGQVPFLFYESIRDNIRYGKPDATQAEIEAAARAAHIHDFIVGLPEGYDTLVGDVGARLSGGQRQRITIARAILKGAPLLLLDEATSALDSESEAEVQRALDGLRADRTVIVIAHRLSTIRDADRIAVLEEGRLVELGTHAELLARDGAYARLHRVQFPEDREVSV